MPAVDTELVEQSRNGDPSAYGRLVERYQSLVRAAAISACGDFSAGEELTQEAFITAWTRLDELREPGRFPSWVCGIARNHARYQRRHDHRHAPAGSDSTDRLAGVPATAPSPLDDAIAKEERGAMRTVLAKIPDSYREPLILFYGQERSIADVAQHLGVSRDTVKQRLHRGRKHLQRGVRKLLRDEFARPVGTAAAVVALIASSAQAQAAAQISAQASARPAQASGPSSGSPSGSSGAQHGGAPGGGGAQSFFPDFASLPGNLAGLAKVAAVVAIAGAVTVYLLSRPDATAPSAPAHTDGPASAALSAEPIAPAPPAAIAPKDAPIPAVTTGPESIPVGSSKSPDPRTAPAETDRKRTPDRARAATTPTVTERGPLSVSRPLPEPEVGLEQALAPEVEARPRAVHRTHRLPIPPPDFADRITDSDF